MGIEMFCPQCGSPTATLREGYCESCRDQNQQQLDLHNAQYDWWNGLTVEQKEALIR